MNSPFLDWGESGFNEVVLDAMDELMPMAKFLIGAEKFSTMDMPGTGGKKVSNFLIRQHLQYPSIDLRCRNGITNKVTAGWAAAASHLHDELVATAPTRIPTLLLYTDGDEVLDGAELSEVIKHFSTDVTRRNFRNCRHDLLLSYAKEDNDKVLDAITSFLVASGTLAA